MKKNLAIILALLLVCTLFAGCNIEIPDKDFTCEDLTITLPATWQDLSSEDYAASVSFLYGFNDTAVMGIREPKSDFEAYGMELTLDEYGQLVLDANGITDPLLEQQGVKTFVYEAEADGESFTYLSGVYEMEESFWIVQAYCLTEDFQENQADMLGYLASVR